MTLFPVLERELIVAARRPATHRTRIAAATTAILATFVFLLTGTTGSQGTGGAMFTAMSSGAFVFALASGIFLSADVISLERREGTLGLLFLTDLDGLDVVLGKMLACGLNAFYGLLAVMPILASSWFLGGVTGGEVLRIAAVLLNSLLLSVALGLWVSTRARAEIQAMGHATAWISLITLVPFFLAWLRQFLTTSALADDFLVYGVFSWSPLTAFIAASDIKYSLSAPLFWTSLTLIHILAWVFVALAAHQLRTGWRDGLESSTATQLRSLHPKIALAQETEHRRRRHARDINPIAVFVETDHRIERFAWICTIAGIAIQAVVLFYNAGSWLVLGAFNLTFLPMKVLVAWKTCAFFVSARRDGAMELLLTTPLSDFEMIQGQMEGLKRLFHKPLIALFLGDLLMPLILLAGKSFMGGNVDLDGFFFSTGSALVIGGYYWVVLIVDLRALHWVGFWLALTEPRPGIAFAKTLLRVVFVPMLLVCIPNIVINGFQLSWARDKFRMNLRAILQGARNPWPVFPASSS